MVKSKVGLSNMMKLLCFVGLKRFAWSLRRLYCPVKNSDLVLEVGSGGNPYFRANVLLDAYEDTQERHWVSLVNDRPTVLGFVEHLPFKDNSFDFVIASHVLEHSTDPVRFLSELQRVAKAGYIEVPDAFMERINPYLDHRLEITIRNEILIIRKKASWVVDPELVDLYEEHLKPILTMETMRCHPFEFHVRYYWNKEINYELLNPEINADWTALTKEKEKGISFGVKGFKLVILKWVRFIFSQRQRNKQINLLDLLTCPNCLSDKLLMNDNAVICNRCQKNYSVRNGIPVMHPTENI